MLSEVSTANEDEERATRSRSGQAPTKYCQKKRALFRKSDKDPERAEGLEPATAWLGYNHVLCQLSYTRNVGIPRNRTEYISIKSRVFYQ